MTAIEEQSSSVFFDRNLFKMMFDEHSIRWTSMQKPRESFTSQHTMLLWLQKQRLLQVVRTCHDFVA